MVDILSYFSFQPVCACVQNMLSASLNKDERDVAPW